MTGCQLPPKRHLWRNKRTAPLVAAGSGAAYQNPTLVCASPSAPVGSFWEDETLAYWLFWWLLLSCWSFLILVREGALGLCGDGLDYLWLWFGAGRKVRATC